MRLLPIKAIWLSGKTSKMELLSWHNPIVKSLYHSVAPDLAIRFGKPLIGCRNIEFLGMNLSSPGELGQQIAGGGELID